MHAPNRGRHLADKRSPATPSRTEHFLRLARAPRETFHVGQDDTGNTRLIQFLRIARGRSV